MNEPLSLEEVQKASFEVLKKIKHIFDENGWKYYLAYGTLIGAVRHNGFIPWDDDIDIWVPRDDYEKFIEYCKKYKESLKPFELMHYSTNKEYIYVIARFSDSRYTIKYNNAKEYGLGVFVDIYPIDGINSKDKKYLRKLLMLIKKIQLIGNKNYVKSSKWWKNIIKYPYYLIIKNNELIDKLEKVDKLAQKYDFNYSDTFECTCWARGQMSYKKEWLNNGLKDTLKEFNGELFRIPYNYDKILNLHYGDYMKLPPENERIAHHNYIVYKK